MLYVEFVPHKHMFIIHFQILVAGALLDEGRERSGGADNAGLDGRLGHRVRFASSSILCCCFFVFAMHSLHLSHGQLAIYKKIKYLKKTEN